MERPFIKNDIIKMKTEEKHKPAVKYKHLYSNVLVDTHMFSIKCDYVQLQ